MSALMRRDSLTRRGFGRALASLAAAAALPQRAGAQAVATVRAAITPVYYDAVPILYAQHAGLFAKAGIDVQLGRLPTGAAITAAVAGGSLDIGKSSFLSVVAAVAHGVPVVAIAPGAVYDSRSPNGALIVGKDSPIHGPADMIGKTIAVNNLAEPTRPAVQLWLQRNNQDKDAIKFVEIPMAAMQAALDTNRIDAIMLTAPVIDEAMATGKYRILAPVLTEIAPRWLFSAYVATHDWARANRDTVKRFADTIAASAAYTNAHHAEMSGTIADLVGATEASIAHETWPTGGTALVPAEMQPMIDISVRSGFIAKGFDARDMIFDPAKP
jgi:NitT/TauT family transport system substrate-binding protein